MLFVHTNGKGGMYAPLNYLREAGVPIAAILDFDLLNQASELKRIVEAITGKAFDPEFERERAFISSIVESEDEKEMISQLVDSVKSFLDHLPSELRTCRKRLEEIKDAVSKCDEVKKIGVDFFDEPAKERVNQLIERLSTIGIFLVNCGQLESWIPAAGKKKGRVWNTKALDILANEEPPLSLKNFVTKVLNFTK